MDDKDKDRVPLTLEECLRITSRPANNDEIAAAVCDRWSERDQAFADLRAHEAKAKDASENRA